MLHHINYIDLYIGAAITGVWYIAALSGGFVAIVVVLILLVVIFLLVLTIRKSKGNMRISLTVRIFNLCLPFVIWLSK